MSVYPVIMCGGSGARLWPASQPQLPKQFIALIGARSSFQDTVLRVIGIRGAQEPIVIAGARHVDVILEQLRALNVTATVLVEPEARDSGPAIGAAAAWIAARDPQGVAVIVSSDHHVPDPAAFQGAVNRALAGAEQGWIVTLGVRPTEPSTAFGYIKPGAEELAGAIANVVDAFVEKPDRATAAGYIAAGYLWNSGNFIAAAATLMAELDRYAPILANAARAAIADARPGEDGVFRLGPAFASAPKISIDYALMEKTERAAVTPTAFAWSDLGAWDAVKAASPADADGNSVTGEAVLIDVSNSLVRTSGPARVGLVGVSDLAVVVQPDAILITHLSASQKVKQLVEQLAARPAANDDSLAALTGRFQRWLDTSALPLWWALGADHQQGGFHESLDQDGLPTNAPRRGRVQARQIFVYASAGAAGWPGPWRAAADHGLRYFLGAFRRDDGLFRAEVGLDGQVLNDTAVLYDQAFALLAMAALFRADPQRTDLPQMAARLLKRTRAHFAHPQGGLREVGDQPFQSNPLMHLFEAALAWSEAGGGAVWRALARELAEMAMGRLMDPANGALREYFTADWTPAPGAAGDVVWPGHQFEWAWLLDRWARGDGQGDARARTAALRLFEVGSAGVDTARSLAVDATDARLAIVDARARLWPQTERLKAALCLAPSLPPEQRPAMLNQAADAARGLWGYLDTPICGLWRDRALARGGYVDEPAPASSLYHLIGAVQALSQLVPAAPRNGETA